VGKALVKRLLKGCEVGRMTLMDGPWRDNCAVATHTVVPRRNLLFRDTELWIMLSAILFPAHVRTIPYRTVELLITA
jgi:hypothetical protein